jgi:hypothetical protein
VLTRESPTAQLSALATSRSVVAVSIRDTRLSGIIPVPLGRENWVDSWRIVVLNPHIATEDVPAGRLFSHAY